MPSVPYYRDLGAVLEGHYAGFVNVTAGGGNDGSEQTGPWIDRRQLESGKVVVGVDATLDDTETVKLDVNLADADDDSGTNSGDFGSAATGVTVATGTAASSSQTGDVELDFDLSGARQYVRVEFTPTMSNSSGDTANIMPVLVLGGGDELPLTNQAN